MLASVISICLRVCMSSCLILSFALVALSQTAAKRPFVPEDLLRMESTGHVATFSPDGELLLLAKTIPLNECILRYSFTACTDARQFRVLPTHGGVERQVEIPGDSVSTGPGFGDGLVWSPDSQRISCLRGTGRASRIARWD